MSNIMGKLAALAVRDERNGIPAAVTLAAALFARGSWDAARYPVDAAEIDPFATGAPAAEICSCFPRRRSLYVSIQASIKFGLRTVSIRRNKYTPIASATILAAHIPAHGDIFPCRAQ